MSGSRKTVEQRFRAISSNKKRGIISGVSALCAVVIVCGAMAVSGAVSGRTEIYGANETVEVNPDYIPWEDVSGISPNLPEKNPYNDAYIDISGRTIGDVAENMGITLEEFLADYALPSDMPSDTTETAAYNMVPFWKQAEIFGMTVDELKSSLGLPDTVTADTPWGQALDEAPLGSYVGTGEQLEQFKDYFGLDNSVNENTKWKEIRFIIEEKNRQEYLRYLEENE